MWIPKPIFLTTLTLLAGLMLAGALAGGVGGYYSTQLNKCQDNARSEILQLNDKLSAQNPPQCRDQQTWTSNLTLNTYHKVCNVDLSGNIQKTNIMNTVTATFDGCLYMCDTYSQVGKESGLTVEVAVWSENGNGTGGYRNANAPGMCWCVHINQASHRMARVEGAQAGLLEGSYSASSLPGT